MPIYIDIHELNGSVSEKDVAAAHAADEAIQGQYGVTYHKYWLNESCGKIFCLCSAPNALAASIVHSKSHGLKASKIIEVTPELAEGFLGGCEVTLGGAALIPGTRTGELDKGVRTLLFTDIVDSTAHTQRFGDEAAMAMLLTHDQVVRDALKATNGREIKHTGDGIMACFVSAVSAVRCSVRIHSELQRLNSSGSATPINVRIGLAAGEPVERNNDLFGTTVQLAARLCSSAKPCQSLVSAGVAEMCHGKGLSFRDLGDLMLKGFERAVRVHEVEQPA